MSNHWRKADVVDAARADQRDPVGSSRAVICSPTPVRRSTDGGRPVGLVQHQRAERASGAGREEPRRPPVVAEAHDHRLLQPRRLDHRRQIVGPLLDERTCPSRVIGSDMPIPRRSKSTTRPIDARPSRSRAPIRSRPSASIGTVPPGVKRNVVATVGAVEHPVRVGAARRPARTRARSSGDSRTSTSAPLGQPSLPPHGRRCPSTASRRTVRVGRRRADSAAPRHGVEHRVAAAFELLPGERRRAGLRPPATIPAPRRSRCARATPRPRP